MVNALFENHIEKLMCTLQSVCDLLLFLPCLLYMCSWKAATKTCKEDVNEIDSNSSREGNGIGIQSYLYIMFRVGCHQYDGRCTCLCALCM